MSRTVSFQVTKPTTKTYLNMLIYGAPGSGKTTLAATAQDVPEMQNVLYIDVESGSLSIAHRSDIDVVRIYNYAQFSKVHEFLRLHCQYRDAGDDGKLAGLAEAVGAEPKPYNTVVIDSLTEIQKQVMYMLLGIEVGHAQLDLIPETPEFREWGQSAEMMRLLVRSFRDLPMNVIFVCAEQEVENERKQLLRRPALPGKLGTEIMGFLDVVGYLATAHGEDGDLRRRLYITPGRTFQAKHRFSQAVVGYFDDPTMAQVWQVRQ